MQWKLNPTTDSKIISERINVNAPPMINTADTVIPDYSTFADAVHTPFKPNPIKHWRKQNSSAVSSEMGRATSVKNNMGNFTRPAGTSITPQGNAQPSCTSDCVEADYMVAYRSNNDITNPGINVSCNSEITQRLPNNDTYSRNAIVCNPEKSARKRTQYPSAVNTQVYTNETTVNRNKSKYNQSNREYLRSRCRTYTQNQNIGNCSQVRCDDASCYEPIITPNNPKFSQQGAASNSANILRRKYNAIRTNANEFMTTVHSGINGPAIAAAVSYSSNTNTPFTGKNKLYTNTMCRIDASKFRRNGRNNACSA